MKIDELTTEELEVYANCKSPFDFADWEYDLSRMAKELLKLRTEEAWVEPPQLRQEMGG